MTGTSISLQELRRRIYLKAKAESNWRFWGLYVHVCKTETIEEAYKLAKRNNGAPGIDGKTFGEIEREGLGEFLANIREELKTETYLPERNRIKEIPKGKGKTRQLGIPTIKDRVVQGALKLILEPIFEADFQEGSFGYRPKKEAGEAVRRVKEAIVRRKTHVIDLDLKAYFDTIRHDILLKKVAERVDDKKVMRLLKLILKSGGKRGVPQGGVISPLLSNIYLNPVDRMLEKAKEVTTSKGYTNVEYARFADDIVVLITGHEKWEWLRKGVYKRLKEELQKLGVEINQEKTKKADMMKGEKFKFLGFDFKRMKTRNGKWSVRTTPTNTARKKILETIKRTVKENRMLPIKEIVKLINTKIRGWVNYFRIGNSSRCFSYLKDYIEKKIRRHMMKTRARKGYGWKRWSREFLYKKLELYADYKTTKYNPKALPTR